MNRRPCPVGARHTPYARGARRPSGRPATRLMSVLAALLLAATLAGCSTRTSPSGQAGHQVVPSATATWSAGPSAGTTVIPTLPYRGNPFAEGAPFVSTQHSPALSAASSASDPGHRRILERIGEVPTATWVLPEHHPLGAVGSHVADLVAQANHAGQVPVLVLYGIPGRDCIHGHSDGGLTPGDYLAWVREVAEQAGRRAVVVLEPDALASARSCNLDHDRLALLAQAVDILATGPTTYVDAGHSGWLDAATTADLLRQVGIDRVRGFALNVAGFGAEEQESRHGRQVAALLGGSRFVVDTGRSGNGSDGTWCNPAGRALGALPGPVRAGAMDARLWIKPPGESDGTCGGGPAAGTFWPDRAVSMAVAAGW